MKSLVLYFWVVFCGLQLVACAGPRINVDPEWGEKPSSISVAYSLDLRNGHNELFSEDIPDYSGDFGQWFSEQLRIQLSQKTGIPADRIAVQVVSEKNEMGLAFDRRSGFLGDESFDFPVCLGVTNMPKSDVNVCIEGVSYLKTIQSYGFGLLGLLFFSGDLSVSGNYSIYNGQHRVAYGKVSASEEFMFGTEDDEWYNSVERVVENIIEGTPLNRK